MTTEELYNKLDNVDHTKEKRWQLAKQIIANPYIVTPLLKVAFLVEAPISLKACWSIEYACKNDLTILLPHLDYFTKNLHKMEHESSIRPMAKICELLMLDYFKKTASISKTHFKKENLEQIATVCFDWLISDCKVASKAYSMTSLLLLGNMFPWIHPELKMILEQNYAEGSAAYKARARMTLEKLNKI